MDFSIFYLPEDDSDYPIDEDKGLNDDSGSIISPGAHAIEMLKNISENLVPFIVPIYHPDSQDRGQGYGSSFLIQVSTSTFLITAAHVIDENEKTTLYAAGANEELQPLEDLVVDESYRTVVPEGGAREDDTCDIAHVEVDPDKFSSQFKPILIDRVDPNDQPTNNARYLLQGFPWRKNEPAYGTQRVKRSIISYSAGSIASSRYKNIGLDPEFHVALIYNPKEVYMPKRLEQGHGPLAKPANPEGMSGGPIWRVPSDAIIRGNENGARLVGLCSELVAEEKTIYGARISLVLESIRNLHPELSESIPETHLGKIKVREI